MAHTLAPTHPLTSLPFPLPPLQALPTFFSRGFSPFQAEYEARSVLLGKRVRFKDGGGGTLAGTVTAIGSDGKLYIAHEGAPAGTPAVGYLSGEVAGIEVVPGVLVEGAGEEEAAAAAAR